jgi:hypothetical protein
MAPEIGIGTVLGADAPMGLPDLLEGEATRLCRQRERVKIAFTKKRLGKDPVFILIRLQEFIAEFARRRPTQLPLGATRSLSPRDLADLIEAGKGALGRPENQTITYPVPIDKALRRFRKCKNNQVMCNLLKNSAFEACDRLWPAPPAF